MELSDRVQSNVRFLQFSLSTEINEFISEFTGNLSMVFSTVFQIVLELNKEIVSTFNVSQKISDSLITFHKII